MWSLIGRKYNWKFEGGIDYIHRFQVGSLARMYVTGGSISVSKGVMGANSNRAAS